MKETMKQFRHASQYRDGKSQRSWSDENTCHVGVRIRGRMQEVYRIERVNAIPECGPAKDEIHVSDMLDEGHWFAPTVERRSSTRSPKTVILRLAQKYEKLARKQLLEK